MLRLLASLAIALTITGAVFTVLLGVRAGDERTAEASSTVTVSTVDYIFNPAVVTIQVGDTVKWTSNNLAGGDISNHTTTSDPGVVPAWNGQLPPPNTSYSVTFNAPGTYTYHCEIHPASMTGSVIVEEPPTATPTPTPTFTPSPTPTSTPTALPNALPSVTAGISPIGGPAALNVTLDWYAADADAEPLDAIIDWGDASNLATVVSPPYGNQQHLHTYADPGSYQITLQVQDALGVKATTKKTVLVGPDLDGDQVPDAFDNCPPVPNTRQANADSKIDNGPRLAGDDATVPNAVADTDGDACESDGDIDNDGLPDANESPLVGCGAFDGTIASHPSPAGDDATNDDDEDGDPAPPTGTDVADDGPSWDTDNDGVLDGYECANGANPRDRLSKPAPLGDDNADSDGDGLRNGWERHGWGTNPSAADSDGDGLGDCREAADIDGNGLLNSTGDLQAFARALFNAAGKTQAFDFDKNGLVNSTGDLIDIARRVFQLEVCL